MSASSFSPPASISLTVCGCTFFLTGSRRKTVSGGGGSGGFSSSGGGFADSGFGLPVVNFVDSNGVLLGQVRATALTGGGTTLTVPFPTNQNSLSGVLPGLHPGTVTVSVYNQTRADNFSSPASISLTVN